MMCFKEIRVPATYRVAGGRKGVRDHVQRAETREYATAIAQVMINETFFF